MEREVTIDDAGRVALPQDVRDLHHLISGSRLKLIDEDDRLVLVPEHREPRVLERDGLLVVTGTGPVDIDHRELREERLDAPTPGWRKVFGKASPEAVAEVDAVVARDLERIDPAEWR